MKSDRKKIKKLVKEACAALESEIEAVLERPSRDFLSDGKSDGSQPDRFIYSFTTQNPSFQYVDTLRVVNRESVLEGSVEDFRDNQLRVSFEKPLSNPELAVEVEWENDFVLRRILAQLQSLDTGKKSDTIERLSEIFSPAKPKEDEADDAEILHDGHRNPSQLDALQKALRNRVTFIWGPPGTGKTATLGFLMANYLIQGKSVLFVSNTNRAVDVGLISVLQALDSTGKDRLPEKICRFGENALDADILEPYMFDQQLEKAREHFFGELAEVETLRHKKAQLIEKIAKLVSKKKKVPGKLEFEIELIENKLESMEGDYEEKLIESEALPFKELLRKKVVATTMARVCTSDLLGGRLYDAVVVDEASMANLPYLLVLASRSKAHFVVTGDPMQLPPIALTENPEHRKTLETDIFSVISGAASMEELFAWQDQNPEITAFFDTQYRLKKDLAGVISEVFYGGRLKTGVRREITTNTLIPQEPVDDDAVSVYVVNSKRYGPHLTIEEGERGFKPLNPVHLSLSMELIRRLMMRERIPESEIGIIVPFRHTAWEYKKALRDEKLGQVETGTIHTFQGREKDVIIFDTVMSGDSRYGRERHFSVRPFDEDKNGLSVPRLLNVAFSRAKSKLVIIADMHHIDSVYRDKFLGNLIYKFTRLQSESAE